MFDIEHFPSSFYPRATRLNVVEAEPRLDQRVIEGLRSRGHDVRLVEDGSIAHVTATGRQGDGVLLGAASPTGMQAYALGR
jgi:gamma-glutamyltranspeptidase/glutathione hydrolase